MPFDFSELALDLVGYNLQSPKQRCILKDLKHTLFLGFTGTLYFMVEIALIGTAITLLIELDRFRHIIFHRVTVGIWFSSFFVSLIVQLIQRRITLLIFVENGTRMAVQNRAPFMHYCYFLMFTAMTRALTSYLLRTIKLLFRYPIFSIRVDRNAETWGVRRGDAGFAAYCGMVS